MGRRGRPPGMPEPGEEPQEWLPSEDEAASAQPPAEPAVPPVVQRPTTPVQPAQPRADQAATPDPAPPAPASEPTFEEIFGTPTPDAPEPTPAPTSRPAEPVAPVQTGSVATSGTNDGGASAVDALASAVGSSTSQTPWATATTASTAEPDRAPRERAPKASRQGKPRRERTRGVAGGIAILVVIVVILGGVFGGGWLLFGDRIMAQFAEPEDFAGAGEGEIVVRIEQGWSGGQVATMLEEEGVIADQQVFYDLLLADPSIGFQPGSYRLALEMSAQAALDALQDPANAAVLQATIPEGFVIQQVFARLAESTGVPESDFVQAASNPATFGVDASNLEGWLFPATYTFEDGATAESMLQTMVDRMRQALTERGVAEADWQRVITFASLVEREGGPAENFGQVARVFQNRLDIGMLLQSDATVHYGIGDFGVITTTDEERGDAGNAYNTYVHPGLPIGPIGAPGDAALDSVLAPADGPWLYFVTIDPSTGETVFSETLAEHNQAVLQFQEWLRANPDYGS